MSHATDAITGRRYDVIRKPFHWADPNIDQDHAWWLTVNGQVACGPCLSEQDARDLLGRWRAWEEEKFQGTQPQPRLF